MKKFDEVYKVVKESLSKDRLKHSEGVMQRCVEFAKLNNVDIEKAKLIGIAHDIAKEIPKQDRVKLAIENGVELDEFEKENTSLIHAKLGAKICKEKFGFTDEMCDAIATHTTAGKDMKILNKILYLSYYCEPNRDFSRAIDVYEIGKEDLNEGYYQALIGKIKYMMNKEIKIHYNSIEAYNQFIEENR